MEMRQFFGYLSAIFVILCTIPYIRDVFLRKTKPQRATWLIYSVLGSISFFSQLAEGATFSLWLTGMDTVSVIFIFLLSLKYGVGGVSKRDVRSLIAAAIALVIWYFTKSAVTALYIVIGIDALGTWLTLEKAYKDPDTETPLAWFFCVLGGICSMIAVGSWDIILLSYPAYIVIANLSVVVVVLWRRRVFKHV